jgi:hypothetical protein
MGALFFSSLFDLWVILLSSRAYTVAVDFEDKSSIVSEFRPLAIDLPSMVFLLLKLSDIACLFS